MRNCSRDDEIDKSEKRSVSRRDSEDERNADYKLGEHHRPVHQFRDRYVKTGKIAYSAVMTEKLHPSIVKKKPADEQTCNKRKRVCATFGIGICCRKHRW